ncbi:hypothetical protein LPN04_31450 [Rugamonas sp. A1-17]|nr:hypothetical protein [Rugamonas sp. A1-17]
MKKPAIYGAYVAAIILVAGCASTEVKREAQADKATAIQEIAVAKAAYSADVKKPIILPTLHTPFFEGESVAEAPTRSAQPTQLLKWRQFHLKGPGVLTIQTLARAISEETGLPVVVDQAPKQPQDPRGSMVKTVDVSALPEMPIEQFLNVATATLGIDWDWVDNALHLSSTSSRTYQVSNTTSTSKGTMKLGKSGTSQAGTSTGNNGTAGTFSSQLDGEITNESDPWGDMEATIKSIAGADNVVRGRTLGLFVVNCSKSCHKQVKEFVDMANHIMTQQVLFHIVEMTVETSSKGQSGINWNILYKQVANKYSVSFGSPTSLVSGTAGNVAFNILNPNGGAQGFDGSSAIFDALSAATHVIEAKPFDMLAINNEPTTLSNINQQTFTASTTVVPTGISGTPVYTQNPGYVTYGQLIQILPTILPDQKVLVRFGIDDTKLKALIPASTPSGMDKVLQGGLSYQTKAVLKIGSTLILSGFKVKTSSLNEQGILSGQRVGSEAGSLDSTETIIMITPYLAGV